MSRRERRAAEVRVVAGEDGRSFEALAVAYGVVDDYGTRFVPGWATEALERRLPVIAWAHDWSEPIGRATSWRETDEGLFITGRLSDPDAVPRARQAAAQLRDGDITDVSVGFMRLADRTADDGVTEITKGELDEVSLVLRGAVPGARILAVRSGGGTVPADLVLDLARKVAAGEVSHEEAKAALHLVADNDEPVVDADPVVSEEDAAELLADADAASAKVDAFSR